MSQPALSVRPQRQVRLAIGSIVAVLLAALVVWYVNSPSNLPTTEDTINAETTAGRPVYVGVFAAGSDFERSLRLSGVKVHTTANTQVDVVPHLCRNGSLAVTSEPGAFCGELVNPEGQTFESGDSIVLEVTGDETAIAVIDRVRLGFREGLQWGTREAGANRVIVTIQGR
jgi:predicted small integral membrane protein